MPTVDEYLSLVAAQHQAAPRFMATLRALLEPFVAQQEFLAGLPAAFDLDEAEGVQLDAVGLWVGVSRFITVPIASVFFTFDQPGLGFNEGYWRGPFDTTSGLMRLDDPAYRLILRARIAANHWDGTLSGAQAAFGYIFADPNTRVFIQDEQDGSYSLNVSGQPLTPLYMALLTGGYIPLKPAGYRLANINTVSVSGTRLFGFDLNDDQVAGFDLGTWGTP